MVNSPFLTFFHHLAHATPPGLKLKKTPCEPNTRNGFAGGQPKRNSRNMFCTVVMVNRNHLVKEVFHTLRRTVAVLGQRLGAKQLWN
jgi:hypothetical protein